MRFLLSAAAIVFGTSTSGAFALTNGDFSAGFLGWDGKLCPFSCNDAALPNSFVDIVDDGTNSYVEIKAPSVLESLSSVQIRQSVTIDALKPFLEIDAGFVSESFDALGQGSNNLDDLVVGLATPSDAISLFRVTRNGGSATNSAPAQYKVMVTDTGPGPLQYSFKADLSSLAGQTFELYIGTFIEPLEGLQSVFAFDNVRFSGPVTGVPLPPGMLLAGTGMLALIALRRRRG
ncbi:MAG: VPLPA-CTERM sorting domain-containing protein [Pseudomonadota bacterium]